MTLEALEACRPPSQAIRDPLRLQTIYHHHLPRPLQRHLEGHTITIRAKHLRRHIPTTTPLPATRIRVRTILKQQVLLVTLEPYPLRRARSTLNLKRRDILVPSLLLLRLTLTEATALQRVLRHILLLHRVSNPGRLPHPRLIPAMDSPHRLRRTANTRRTVLHLHLLPHPDKALEVTEGINRGLTE